MPPASPGVDAASLVDRLLVGRTRDGFPEVRLDLAAGELRGTEVRLLAGLHGIEATFVTTSAAARRAIEARLDELARGLRARGVAVARCRVTARADGRRPHQEHA